MIATSIGCSVSVRKVILHAKSLRSTPRCTLNIMVNFLLRILVRDKKFKISPLFRRMQGDSRV